MKIKWIGSPNFGYPRGAHGQNDPEALFWHITASSPSNPPLSRLDSWFQHPEAGSTQLGIQDKECHQYVAFRDACWGQGYINSPDMSNPNVLRWLQGGINPNIRSIGIEVVAMPGLVEVPRGIHLLNDNTWNTMKEVGRYVVEEFPKIGLVTLNWMGHWQVDGVNRQRDPKNVYWPTDILEEILESELIKPAEDNVAGFAKYASKKDAGPGAPNGWVYICTAHTKRRMHGEKVALAKVLGIPADVEVANDEVLDRLVEIDTPGFD